MSLYRDGRTKITAEKISIRGAPIPIISGLVLEKKDIKSITFCHVGWIHRLIFSGPVSPQIWWCFDPFKPLRQKAVVITLNQQLVTFNQIAQTFSDFDAAAAVLKEHFPELIQ